jgi:hypothetical protein
MFWFTFAGPLTTSTVTGRPALEDAVMANGASPGCLAGGKFTLSVCVVRVADDDETDVTGADVVPTGAVVVTGAVEGVAAGAVEVVVVGVDVVAGVTGVVVGETAAEVVAAVVVAAAGVVVLEAGGVVVGDAVVGLAVVVVLPAGAVEAGGVVVVELGVGDVLAVGVVLLVVVELDGAVDVVPEAGGAVGVVDGFDATGPDETGVGAGSMMNVA